MRILNITALFLLLSASVWGQVHINGDITDYIDDKIGEIPGNTPAGLYEEPDAAERVLWQLIVQNIMIGNYATAHSDAATLEYRVVRYTDYSASPDKVYYILERTPSAATNYWGTFVFNPDPLRYRLVIQCPHPLHDLNTGRQGFRVFRESGARAYFVSGAKRCNSSVSSPCDGTTTACTGSSAPYRISDQPHVVNGTFQITTEKMLVYIPDMIIIQPHGFSKGAEDPDIIMSNGSQYTPPGTDYLLALRDNLLVQDNTLTFKVAHVDLDWTELIARTNTQGRLINEVASPCGTYANHATGRFLHLEQAYSKLRDNETNWYKLVNAVIQTFPEDDQVISLQSGPWQDPSTWIGGVIPDSEDNVLIAAGHTVSIDDTLAECHSLMFGGNDALIDMNNDSRLSVYGDFTLFSTSHNVFSAGWSSDSAYIRFTGDEELQLLSGWNTSGGSTSFRDVIIDKDTGTVVTTSGAGMRLAIQNSLEVISGSLIIEDGDDLEARWTSSGNFTNDQNLTITIHSDGKLLFIEGDGTHFVRSNTGSIPIGRMTIYGEAQFYNASSYDISIAGIDIKNGGTLLIGTGMGSTTYGPEFNPGTITVDSGGSVYNITTSDVWFDTSVVILNRGGTYKTSSSSTILPPTFINDGKVRYQRNPETVTTDQVIVDTNYYAIEFSFNGNATRKIWTLGGDRYVEDSLIINNDAEFILQASSPHSLTVSGTLRLTSGSFDNGDPEANLVLADGILISRATATISDPPVFSGNANVRYTSLSDHITTGPELPTDPTVLSDLVIDADMGVTLGADVTVNGTLAANDGILSTGSYRIALAEDALIAENPGFTVQGRVEASRILTTAVNEDFGGLGLEITASGDAPGETEVLRVTGVPQMISGREGIARYFDISPTVNVGLNAVMVFHYADEELNDLSESSLALYSSENEGVDWALRGGEIDTEANTVSLDGIDSFSRWTLGELSTFVCGDCNRDGGVNLTDILNLISYVYVYPIGEPEPDPPEAGDVNSDFVINLTDILNLISHLYVEPIGEPVLDCP